MALRAILTFSRLQSARLACTPNLINCNHYARSKYSSDSVPKSIYKKKEAKKIRFFILDKYFEYLKKYEAILQKKFPGAMQVYRVFVDGTSYFFQDLKNYIRIVRLLNVPGKNWRSLKLSEIELYDQMPKDMRRVAPVLLISALPFANYVIFPLAYYFPRHLLCRHFWNLQQKSEFSIIFLRKRLTHNRPVFRHLQVQLPRLRGHELHKKWSNILGAIGSGVQPTVGQIVECQDLFRDGPYHLFYLSGNHVKHLLKMHELHSGWFRRTRLQDRAVVLQAMDQAIVGEGGVSVLSSEVLKNACLIRGLNPTNMRNEDMIKWLTQWIEISKLVDGDTASLLLHCPVLLGYNQPSNWQLIYKNKAKSQVLN